MTLGELRHWLAEAVDEREEDADCEVLVETGDMDRQGIEGRPRVKLVDGRRVLLIELEW